MYIIHIKPWADRSRQVVFGDNWGRPARHQLRSHHLPPSTCGSGGAVTHTPVIPLLHHKRTHQLVFSCIAIVLGHKRRSLELSSPTILLFAPGCAKPDQKYTSWCRLHQRGNNGDENSSDQQRREEEGGDQQASH